MNDAIPGPALGGSLLRADCPCAAAAQWHLRTARCPDAPENARASLKAVREAACFARLIAKLLREPKVGRLIVPIIPDEARTFGMEALFRQCGIYSHVGQLYEPVDSGSLLYYREAKDGQILEAHSISAGPDYPGVGPEHSWLRDTARVKYFSATDQEALDAFQVLSKVEGIMPALESAHALAHVMREAPKMNKDEIVVVTLSGRGDKDVFSVAGALGVTI